jgi:hypothetical protein
MPHQPGDYIPLHWEDAPEALYCYGHIDAAEFIAVCAAENPGPGVVPIPGTPVHKWGAFRFNGQDDCGNPRRSLFTYAEPGRGRFKLTAADVVRWEVSPDTRNPSVWNAEELAEFARKDAARAAYLNWTISGSAPELRAAGGSDV